MSNKITLVNKRTFGGRVQNVGLVLLLAGLVLVGIKGGDYVLEEFKSGRNVSSVERAIKAGEYRLASGLIDGFEVSGGLGLDDLVSVRLDLESAEGVSVFEGLFSDGDVGGAVEYLAVMRGSGLYGEEDLVGFEARLDAVSESSLFDKVIAASSGGLGLDDSYRVADRALLFHPGICFY